VVNVCGLTADDPARFPPLPGVRSRTQTLLLTTCCDQNGFVSLQQGAGRGSMPSQFLNSLHLSLASFLESGSTSPNGFVSLTSRARVEGRCPHGRQTRSSFLGFVSRIRLDVPKWVRFVDEPSLAADPLDLKTSELGRYGWGLPQFADDGCPNVPKWVRFVAAGCGPWFDALAIPKLAPSFLGFVSRSRLDVPKWVRFVDEPGRCSADWSSFRAGMIAKSDALPGDDEYRSRDAKEPIRIFARQCRSVPNQNL
jgi:hypothetical protein